MRKYLGLLVVNNFWVKGPSKMFGRVQNTSHHTPFTHSKDSEEFTRCLQKLSGLKARMKAYADISHMILGNAGGFMANIRQNT